MEHNLHAVYKMLNIWTHLVVMFLHTYYTTSRIYFKSGLNYVPIDKLCS